MSRVIVYDMQTKSAAFRFLPLGKLALGVSTCEGHAIWKNGQEYLYGKPMVDTGTLMYFCRVHESQVNDVKELKMANIVDVIDAINEGLTNSSSSRISELESLVAEEMQKNKKASS